MSLSGSIRSSLIAAAAFIIIIIGNIVIIAQSAEGVWKGRVKPDSSGEINLSFSRSSEKGGKNWFGTDFKFDEIDGLSAAEVNANRSVNFSIKREAGTIDCTGSFNENRGSGTFKFAANSNFVSSLESLGYRPDLEDLFASVSLDITESFARGVASMGFGSNDFEDVIKAKIFKITPEFAAEIRAAGFEDLSMEDLVKARIFKIDAAFVNGVRQAGLMDRSMESMVKLSIFKVTPEFIDEVRNEGLTGLTIEELVKLRIFKIDGAYIKKARAENVPMNVETLVNRKIGVWGKN